MKPIYQHDCSRCEFIQNFTLNNKHYDIYRCPSSFGGSWIARYSSDGPGYWSAPWDILKDAGPTAGETTLMRPMYELAVNYMRRQIG